MIVEKVVPLALYAPLDKQAFIIKPKLGQQMVGGKITHVIDSKKLDLVNMPPRAFDEVREDIVKMAKIPVTRVALKRSGHIYIGVIDSNDKPFFFALDGNGIMIKPASDEPAAWKAFRRFMDEEQAVELEKRRVKAAGEQMLLNMVIAQPMLNKAVRDPVKNPGSRGGVFYFDKHGHIRYGVHKLPKHPVAVAKQNPFDAKTDGFAHGVFKRIKTEQPETTHELHAIVLDEVKDAFEGDHHGVAQEFMTYLSTEGAVSPHKGEEPAEEEEAGDPVWEKRSTKFKPPVPKPFDVQKTPLVVGGKSIVLSPEAEQAAYAYAKRFVVNKGAIVNPEKFQKNFENSLRKLGGLPDGAISYMHFVKRVKKEEPKEKAKGKKQLETPETHPQLYIMQDGEPTRVMGVIPPGGFYTGKDCYGCWARQLTEADLILNVSKGGTPPGWKGQVMNDPTKDFYVTWRHPVTGEKGYLYTSRAKADLQKFEEAQALGGALDEIRGKVVEDIKSSDPMTKMASLCTLLIDREHFRVGEEEHTATGTYGVASFLVGHVKINGSSVTFEFTGKKEEPWKRTLDFTRMPSALAFLKSCMAGKKPGDRLWSGKNWEATSKNVNEYLDQFSRGGVKFTAKMFRTFHANAYMHGLLNKLAKAQKDLKLSNADVKKLYKGFSVDDAAGKKLINLPYAGTTLGKFMGFTQHAGAKGRGDLKTGVLPTVASRLGHTTGACRNNYINPVTVTKFGADRGWDERTPKEKRTREDLPGFNPEEA